MRLTRHLRPAASRALGVVGLLVVLAGLFGMHGLSSHGVGAVAPGSGGHHAGAVHAAHAAAEVLPGALVAMSRDLVTTTIGSPDGGGHASAGALCLAILAGSMLALLVLLRNRVTPRTLLRVGRPLPVTVRRARSPDPPCLFALSVQRC